MRGISGGLLRGSIATSSMLKNKCEFAKHQVEYLDYIVKDGHVLVDPTKREAV